MATTSAKANRSGYQVAGTALTAGAISSLLAPWISAWVTEISASTGVLLGENYADQVLGLTVAVISWGSSQVKMWWIERVDRAAEDDAGEANDLRVALSMAEFEIERLKRAGGPSAQ